MTKPASALETGAETPYAEKTFRDRSGLKRMLQARRLQDAVTLAANLPEPGRIVDFGAGNGQLCKLLAARFPDARIHCFEPHPGLLEQARENLASLPAVQFAATFEDLPVGAVDQVFCLEVIEHLPGPELQQALDRIWRLLGPHGRAVVGVPVEVGPPALFKGLFRILRRAGEFDARWSHVLRATLGRPPSPRPAVELMPGSFYHLHHLGFDHRLFMTALESQFRVVRRSGSPIRWSGPLINSELNLLLGPVGKAD